MTRPKFLVGEAVILQSQAYPELNGEVKVLDVGISKVCIDREGKTVCEGGYSYLTTIESPTPNNRWHEIALRKKHQPGEMTFEGLIMNLNNPVNVES